MLKGVDIAKGWFHMFKGDRPDFYVERAKICMTCPSAVDDKLFKFVKNEMIELPGKKCAICGCGLQAKLQLRQEKCPKGLWNVVPR